MALNWKSVSSSLFWRLSAILLFLLVLITAIHMGIALSSAKQYSLEVNQRLGRDIAQHTAQELGTLLSEKDFEPALHEIMHSMMVINPDVEVYLLDTNGRIENYVAPYKVVKLEEVDLAPVKTYLADTTSTQIITGNDPRNPGQDNIFSAAAVEDSTGLKGYVYIILASQAYTGVQEAVAKSYVLKTGRDTMLITALASVVLGLLFIWLITRHINLFSRFIRRFQSGDLKARVNYVGSGELGELSQAVNNMAATIENNVEELRGVERLRKELVANISHDLRTPIASISGYAETLQLQGQQMSVEEKTEFLDAVIRNVKRLEKMVADLFELSKLEAKERTIEPEAVQLSDLMQDVVAKYSLLARDKGVSINTMVSATPPLVYADIAMIDRVLQNIVDNALRHCDSGDIIHIELNPGEQAVEVKISDTGSGISDIELPHIFDRYKRSKTHKEGGGLGLAIVKKILELHDSSIHVASKIKEGTTFWFELPVYRAET
jgi:signal transduction histidine kinase